MARTTAATRELSILIAGDIPGAQALSQEAMTDIGEENDIRLTLNSADLLDFLLKSTYPPEGAVQLMPDMIVANYSQPFRDLKIIAEIRKKEQFKHIPIIVVVNENVERTRPKFVEYGVTEVWSRPDDVANLKEKISGYILRLVHAA
jgi:CheY-like chemotaxis protein